MKPINSLSLEEVKEELALLRCKALNNYFWLEQNKRYIALLMDAEQILKLKIKKQIK